LEESARKLKDLSRNEKLPITPDSLEIVALGDNADMKAIISEKSGDKGLTVICFDIEELKQDRNILSGYEQLSDILFVNASELKENS
jgi:hypothetical protein